MKLSEVFGTKRGKRKKGRSNRAVNDGPWSSATKVIASKGKSIFG